MSEADVRRWVAVNVEALGEEERSEASRILARAPRPDEMPVISGLLVDDEGLLWVQAYDAPLGYGTEAMVLDLDGGVVARVRLPEPMRLLVASDRNVVGLTWLPSGEERIAAYRLERGPAHSERQRARCP